MRYLNPSTRIKLNEIITRINEKKLVTLSERILLSKYLDKYPYLNSLFKEGLPKFS
tara:strand:+ start:517 stop:684 length:168 start_codon:yes stop_codon:yes gene_type:complete